MSIQNLFTSFLRTVVALSTLFSVHASAQEEVVQKVPFLPVLVMKRDNPVLDLDFQGISGKRMTLKSISLSFAGSRSLSDVKSVRIFLTPKDGDRSTAVRFGEELTPKETITFTGSASIESGDRAWVSIELNKNADIEGSITVRCISVRTVDKELSVISVPALKQAMGVAIRQNGLENVHTYRIPGLTTTNNGTLLAVYDVRRDTHKDLQGNIDIGLSRSTDGGRTWDSMKIILDQGKWGGLPEKFNGVSDANIVVDKNDNSIYVFGLWMHGVLDKKGKFISGLTDSSTFWEHQWKDRGSQPGFGERETSQVLYTVSRDDGKTWSIPINVTRMFKKSEWWLGTIAPGHGISLTDGTIVIPTQGRDSLGIPFSNITWSKDKGQTWHTSNPAYRNTTESMAVQLADGSIMLNMRHNQNRGNSEHNGRAVAVTRDLGTTWTEHPTSRNALIEPTCMASLHRHEYKVGGRKKSVLLFSNPNSTQIRNNITIKVSFDEGRTWPEKYWTLIDEGTSRGYSCLTTIDEDTIGILYEGSQASMTFQRIPLKNLLKK